MNFNRESSLRLPLIQRTLSVPQKYIPPVEKEDNSIFCWKNPPEVISTFWKKFFSTREKVILIVINILILMVLISVSAFAVSREETVIDEEILSVSIEYPLIIPIDLETFRPVLEAIVYVNEVHHYNSTKGEIQSSHYHATIYVTLEGKNGTGDWELAQPAWKIEVRENYEEVHDFDTDLYPEYDEYRWNIFSDTKHPSGFVFRYREIFKIVYFEVGIAASILTLVYVLIIFDVMHRTIAALIGSFICVSCLTVIHGRPSFIEVVNWIDFNTIGLLFGMMIMIGIFSETGFFEWTAIKAYKLSGGNLWKLTFILCSLTGIISAFLDDVTTILLLTPITIRLCKVLDVDPKFLLLSVIMFSNIGGASTGIGDPPNIIIISNAGIEASGEVNFVNYSMNVVPGVIFASIFVFGFLYFKNRESMKRIARDSKSKEIDIWISTAGMLRDTETDEERRVKQQLIEYVQQLQDDLQNSPEPEVTDINELEEKYIIRDVPLFINSTLILGCVILMFFLQPVIHDYVDLALPWIALIGAMVHLLVAGIKDIDRVLQKVEFATLLFFAGLFVLMNGLKILGLFAFVGDQISLFIARAPEGPLRQIAAIEIILWVSAFVSGFIDNIPYTTAMVPIIITISENANLPLPALVWSLALGGSFGGNATIIGTSASVVACGMLEAQGMPVSFMDHFKIGFPVMVISMIAANIYLLFTCVLMPFVF